jgi:hypothetical protein
MILFKKIMFQTNAVIVAFLILFSCSTNNQSRPVQIEFNTDSRLNEVISTERRFVLKKGIKQYANEATRAENFFDYLGTHPQIVGRLTFDYTTDTREILLVKIKQSEGLILSHADVYSPLWRFSDVIAYHKDNVIYFNRYKLKRSNCEIIATFVHEYLHRLGYAHGDNNPTNKENSVPYFMGILAKETCIRGDI